ncbi:hypothetical protein D9M68_979480 [compost metagenome]
MSMPARRPASRMDSLSRSMVNMVWLPSMTTVTSVSPAPTSACARGLCWCFGMLAANSSILMFAFGMPASCSAADTPCIMSSGPQMKALS